MAHFFNVLPGLAGPREHAALDSMLAEPCETCSGYGSSCECSPWPVAYVERIIDTSAYLDGWTMVAQLEGEEDSISMLWHMLANDGVKSDFDRGVRDGIDAAYGSLASAS